MVDFDDLVKMTSQSTNLVSEYIASATIARLLKDVAFKKDTTEITEPAVILSGEYIRLFIQEAVLRANEQRLGELEECKGKEGISGFPGIPGFPATPGKESDGDAPDPETNLQNISKTGVDGIIADRHSYGLLNQRNSVENEEPVEEPVEEIGEDESDDERFRGLGLSTQVDVGTVASDALETRHLTAVSGLLLMDF